MWYLHWWSLFCSLYRLLLYLVSITVSKISNTGCIFNLFRNLSGYRECLSQTGPASFRNLRLPSPHTVSLTLLRRAYEAADLQFLSSVATSPHDGALFLQRIRNFGISCCIYSKYRGLYTWTVTLQGAQLTARILLRSRTSQPTSSCKRFV
jgi:hypothetical protein